MKNPKHMNHKNVNHMGMSNTTKWGIIAVTVITVIDIVTNKHYELKGGGSIGNGEQKRSFWFNCTPGKGGRK